MAIPFFNLSDLTGSNGFTINGDNPFDTSGYSVSDAGDINGDGIDDIVIGAPGFTGNDPAATTTPGNVYVVFGTQAGFADDFDLSTLNGTNGFAINGIAADDLAGFSVSGAGDVNGDNIDDLIIGAVGADTNGDDAGASYVVFGFQGGFAPSIDLANLGTNGVTINGIAAGDELGTSVSNAGDVNGDGIDDLIIGAPYANYAGQSYLVFGSEGLPSSIDLANLGTNGVTINGITAGDGFGISVSAAGDVNGDGFGDLIIGAPGTDLGEFQYAGQSYLVFGSEGLPSSLNVSDLDGSSGFVLDGVNAFDFSGRSVSGAGDVNGDGFDDLIIGAYGANDSAGTSYVVLGSPEAFSDSFNLSQLNGDNGFAINGINASDLSGRSVSSAGDFNGDGFDDLFIGAVGADNFTGQSYVVYGKENQFAASIDLSELDPTEGFALNGVNANDFSGISVSAGDINGDGLSDLIVGASYADPSGRTNAGETYVIYGRKPIIGDASNDTLNGTVSDDTIYAGSGNDTIFGNQGVNTLFGQDGNDLIYGGSQADYIYAGNGNDTIYANDGNNNIFGEAGNDIIYSGTGNDLIDGGAGNDKIWLGGGLDRVVLASDNGFDTINNFQLGQTTLGLSGGLTFENLAIAQQGNDTLVEIANGGENLARLVGIQASSINSSSFAIV